MPHSLARPWAVVQHVASEPPGLLADEASARGLTLRIHRMHAGDALPGAEEIGGLIVLGGPMNALEDDAYPHLRLERELVRDAVRRGLPVLGVCLGSQLLAASLGARVTRGPLPEIGFGPVVLTGEGARDPILARVGPEPLVFHWHGDTFDLPSGAVHLARSAAYPHQAFRVGARVYGFQFHMELDADLFRRWIPLLPEGYTPEDPRRSIVEGIGRSVYGAFFTNAAGIERGEKGSPALPVR